MGRAPVLRQPLPALSVAVSGQPTIHHKTAGQHEDRAIVLGSRSTCWNYLYCPVPNDLRQRQAADLGCLSLSGKALGGCGRWSASGGEALRRGAAGGCVTGRFGAAGPEAACGEPSDVGGDRDPDDEMAGLSSWQPRLAPSTAAVTAIG